MRISRTGCLTRIHRGIRLAGKLVEAVILIWVIFPRSESSSRDGMVERWCRQVLDILQIHLTVHGEAPRGRNSSPLFVANHISWIDVLLLHSCRRMRFVAKREVECWPLIGYLAAGTGTWFFKRTSPHELARVMQAAATALKEGDCVAFFPEGTTTDGTAVHAFHSGLFEAAVKAKARIQPVCIRYEQTDGTTDRQVAFLGNESLVSSILNVLSRPITFAHLSFLPPIESSTGTRRQLASLCRTAIEQCLAEQSRSSVAVHADPPRCAPRCTSPVAAA